MSEETVSIEVDGQLLQARKGAMLIEATDAAGISIPRFCYHDKLTVAANCRMCLVEVEKAPKPLPACATPVMDGMKVYTRSQRAVDAQRGTMEFLLINHPLDCPICDQGGECELQDVAMGYGQSVSRYSDTKRVVLDKDIGPLISTDMTRCIHCTRCVRFGEEIAGLRELGATGRGEDMRIGTYVQKSVVSELSGNVIDLCPVGALTAKPSRYTARAWELVQQPGLATHDCVGSNLFYHTRDRSVMRVVPRDNEALNEVWLSDRDRFSYGGLHSEARLQAPMLKENGEWRAVEWDAAFAAVNRALGETAPDDMGFLVTPSASLEELYLLQKLARTLGCGHVDHRLRQADFGDAGEDPVMPWLGQGVSDLERLDAALVVAGNPRKDQPLIAHRLRKAALRGARVSLLNVRRYDQTFEPLVNEGLSPAGLIEELAGVAAALAALGAEVAPQAKDALAKVKVSARQQAVAASLRDGERTAVLLGSGAQLHPAFGDLRRWASVVAAAAGATFGYLPEGGNAAGAWLAGCVPHRGPGGVPQQGTGATVERMLRDPKGLYFLHGVDPALDFGDPQLAQGALQTARTVVAASAFVDDTLRAHADILLPLAVAAEIDATYVNAEGRWQNASAAARPPGAARAGWKILRVLGNHVSPDGFAHTTASEVRNELQEQCRDVRLDNAVALPERLHLPPAAAYRQRVAEVPMYAVDSLVRHSAPLQQTRDAEPCAVHMSSAQAKEAKLEAGGLAYVSQDGNGTVLKVQVDDGIPAGCVWIPLGVPGSEKLGAGYGPVEIEKA